MRLLLAAGADPARADPAGLTPRAAAQAGANAEIAALLAPSALTPASTACPREAPVRRTALGRATACR